MSNNEKLSNLLIKHCETKGITIDYKKSEDILNNSIIFNLGQFKRYYERIDPTISKQDIEYIYSICKQVANNKEDDFEKKVKQRTRASTRLIIVFTFILIFIFVFLKGILIHYAVDSTLKSKESLRVNID